MEKADYQHLVHVSEVDAQERPQWYRQHVMRFAALGFAYVIVTLVLGIALLFLAWWLFTHRKIYPGILSVISGLSLAWVAFSALRMPAMSTEGVEIEDKDAPELFKLLAKLQKKLKAPAIDRVLITQDYNAFITQQSRFGLFGKTTNTLGIGLPLAAHISPQRMLAVLAHEYAHLRGGDGKSAAWIYRTRMAWERLALAYSDKSTDLYSAITQGFMRWYAPRFAAKTFAAARQEEYTADKLSGKLCGKETTAEALQEIALLGNHATRGFWQQYWQQSTQHAEPTKLPYAWLCAGQMKPVQAHELQNALHQLKAEKTDTQDTHPSTQERVKALGGMLGVPTPSIGKATSLLGVAAEKAAREFDKAWWQEQKTHWTAQHRRAQQDLLMIKELQSKIQHLNADDLERLAQLVTRSQPQADQLAIYQRLLAKEPTNANALWPLAMHHFERNSLDALPYADTMIEHHAHYAFGASQLALDLLDRQRYDESIEKLRQRYRNSLKKYEALEDADQEESSHAEHPLVGAQLHGLNAYQLEDLRFSARSCAEIGRLWLLRQPSKTFPWRKRYVAIIQVATRYANDALDIQALTNRLDLPGPCLGLDQRWIEQMIPSKKDRPVLGEPVYPVA